MNLDEDDIEFTSQLYVNKRLVMKDVDNIIDLVSDFISNKYNTFLLDQVETNIAGCVPDHVLKDIKSTITKFKNPFSFIKTRFLREKVFKQLQLYIEPKEITIKEVPHFVRNGSKVQKKYKPIKMVHVSIKRSVSRLLQVKNLLDETILYTEELKKTDILQNFCQGELWQKLTKNFKKNRIGLPLIYYSDDIEFGNALGAHAGANKVGTGYLMIPSLPPSFSSKLSSIILSDLFYAHDRKTYGNEAIFKTSIKELDNLEKKGLPLQIKGVIRQVYFATALITGDNLGLNGMLGFVESFFNTIFCRICYSFPAAIRNLTKENEKLLRTVELYEADLKCIDTKKSGLKQRCVFNELNYFHVITNPFLDILHDVYEGICSYTMAEIIISLINDNFFDMNYLNFNLKTIDFGFDSNNKPMDLSLDYLKKNGRLKMSATECLFFTRYFSIMVGSKVDGDNIAWKLYLKLRDLVNIASAPAFSVSHLDELGVIVGEFLSLYKFFIADDLTGKFHLLIHYKRTLLANGPPSKVSTIRAESYHKFLKLLATLAGSKKNILLTVAKRIEYANLQLKYSKYEEYYTVYGKKTEDVSFVDLRNPRRKRYWLSKVEINSYTYKPGTIILIGMSQPFPEFGKITKIYEEEENIFFQYVPLKSYGFDSHYFAYAVFEINDAKCIAFKELNQKITFLLYKTTEDKQLVISRHVF